MSSLTTGLQTTNFCPRTWSLLREVLAESRGNFMEKIDEFSLSVTSRRRPWWTACSFFDISGPVLWDPICWLRCSAWGLFCCLFRCYIWPWTYMLGFVCSAINPRSLDDLVSTWGRQLAASLSARHEIWCFNKLKPFRNGRVTFSNHCGDIWLLFGV